jgi:hypothetical protein
MAYEDDQQQHVTNKGGDSKAARNVQHVLHIPCMELIQVPPSNIFSLLISP